jgi:microcystin-dependent protein
VKGPKAIRYNFAGDFTPGSSLAVQGQLLSVSQHPALFAALGFTYGGNGVSTFALPNLQGTAIIGTGAGTGLIPRALGAETGPTAVTLTVAQIPPHDHSLPDGGLTGKTGNGQPFNNMQPSLPLQTLIATSGAIRLDAGGRANAVDRPEYGIVFRAGIHLRWQRGDNLQTARPARTGRGGR